MNRRSALKAFVAAGAIAPGLAAQVSAPSPAGSARRTRGYELGVATVSLRALPLEQALAAVTRVGLKTISLNRAHSPWDSSPAAWKSVAEQVRAAGVHVRCCGVLYLKNEESAMRRMMEYVRALDVTLFSCSVERDGLPLLEKLVREYDLRAAIHNHGPEDKSWPGAMSVWEAIQPLDERIGVCLDVGHSFRAHEDPVELIRRCRSRLYDVHLKDTVAERGATRDVPVEVGRGTLDIVGMLTALIETGYRENVWLEYEKDPNDPVPGLAESVGYVRGLLRGLNIG